MHPRQQIIAGLREMLATPIAGSDPPAYPTDAGRRVYMSRLQSFTDKTLPAISIHPGIETIDDRLSNEDGSRTLRRKLEVNLDVVAAVDDALDAVTNAIAWQVERRIEAYCPPDRPHDYLHLLRTEPFLTRDGASGDGLLGALRLVYLIAYWTAPPAGPAGSVPRLVLGSWVPRIGIPHEDAYQAITGGTDG